MYFGYSLNFADTNWQFLSIFAIFITGLYISVFQCRIFRVRKNFAVLMYLYHTALCIYYMIYSWTNSADATGYFINSFEVGVVLNFGTDFVNVFTAIFTQGLGLSYGGTFLLYNIFGYIGLIAVASALQELTQNHGEPARRFGSLYLLLPGLSFWSAAIGKDALAFFAVGLACWSSLNLVRRYPSFVIAVVVMLLVRPHMAAILLSALCATVLLSRWGSVSLRVLLTMVTIPFAAAVVSLASSTIGLGEDVSAGAIGEYIEQRQGYNTEGGLGIDIASMSIPARIFSYMYRPLFVDGGGLLGLVISVENLFLLVLTLAAVLQWIKRRPSTLPNFAWWFMAIYMAVAWLVLSNTTANLGIAMRQKWMFAPMLLLLCFSYFKGSRNAPSRGASIIHQGSSLIAKHAHTQPMERADAAKISLR